MASGHRRGCGEHALTSGAGDHAARAGERAEAGDRLNTTLTCESHT
jgi:hypothetical protein